MKLAPWYIIEDYNNSKISFDEFMSLMDKYYSKEPIEINIYDAIEKVYKISQPELAERLNVPHGVIGYARTRGTIARRSVEFSNKLNLPIKYFSKVTNLDIPDIENILLK